MQSLTAVVLGATGMIGELLVQQLLDDQDFSKVRILVRRPLQLSHSKLETAIVDFNDQDDFRIKLGTGNIIFCCIGTTIKQVKGNKNLYRSIDYDIPVNAAMFGKQAGFTSFSIVSAVGANDTSSNFYLKLKGEVENKLSTLQYNRLYIFRPSLLLGNRKEFRISEKIGKSMFKLLSFVFIGPLKKYMGAKASEVALAMIQAAKKKNQEFIILNMSR